MRFLRSLFFLSALPFVLLAMLVLGMLGYSLRRKEADEELLALADIGLVQSVEQAELEHDDKERSWFADLAPDQRIGAVESLHARAAAEVCPEEPFSLWSERRRKQRMAARGAR